MGETPIKGIERFNSITDYYKHLTTLSTGSIVIIATFLEKLFSKPLWKFAVGVSLVGFMLSVLSSVIAHTLGIFFEHPEGSPATTPEWVSLVGGIFLLLTWLGFLVGVLSLAVFAIRNL